MMGKGHSNTTLAGSRFPVSIVLSETFYLDGSEAKLDKFDQKFTCEGCN